MKWVILSAIGAILLIAIASGSNNSPAQKPSELIAQACKAQYVIVEEEQACEIRQALRVLGAREQAKQDAVDS